MPLRRVARAAAQQAEPVLEATGDLGDRHDPYPRRRQLHRQRQPVELAADLLDRAGGQVGAGACRPGALDEQLHAGRQAELGQLVHRLRGEAERRAAGGEHAQVLRHRHQGVDQLGGAAEDVLAVVQDQQGGTATERADDAGEHVGRDGLVGDRGAPRPAQVLSPMWWW